MQNLPKPPHISAKSWIIFDLQTNKMFQGKKETVKREMASITKMMNFYTVLRLMEKSKLCFKQVIVTVSKTAASITGTSANLKEGDQFTVADLIYGMMLPSGNDAAYALAEHFGTLIQKSLPPRQNPYESIISPIRQFLREMNKYAHRLKLTSTQFDSPHGLSNKCNFSTAKDICALSIACMKIPRFREVVGTK